MSQTRLMCLIDDARRIAPSIPTNGKVGYSTCVTHVDSFTVQHIPRWPTTTLERDAHAI